MQGCKEECKEGWMEGWMDRLKDGQMDGRMDGWKEGRKDATVARHQEGFPWPRKQSCRAIASKHQPCTRWCRGLRSSTSPVPQSAGSISLLCLAAPWEQKIGGAGRDTLPPPARKEGGDLLSCCPLSHLPTSRPQLRGLFFFFYRGQTKWKMNSFR